MPGLHPSDRPKTELAPLVRALAAHGVDSVLCGSYVLALHGGDIVPNDLDVVPRLTPANLGRLGGCLREIGAVCAYAPGWPAMPLEAARRWTPQPATAENLDQLLVTPHGMLDIVIALAPPYESLMAGARWTEAEGVGFFACDPCSVLRALEGRTRPKDRERAAVYARLRSRFGLDVTPPDAP